MKSIDQYPFLRDGNMDFSGGMDGNTQPHLLPRNMVAGLVNATVRGGRAKPRPGLRKIPLTFETTDVQSAFQQALFQHGSFYDGANTAMLISAHGGRIFRTEIDTWEVFEITPDAGRNSSRLPLGWSVQAEEFWIYQDNQSLPVIFDGSSSRRANVAKQEVPVGNVMSYAMGRLLVALPDRRSYRAGNLVFENTGSTADLLRFDDNNYLNEGGDFAARVFGAPSSSGPILAMKAVAMEDSQLGQGPVIIGQPEMVFTANLPFDRTTWKNLSNALQTANPIKGPISQGSVVLVNGDLWYRAIDGIRSFVMARREFGSWGNTPMSNELNLYLNNDTPFLLEHCSAVLFNNRLLMTLSPVQSQFGVWHRGLASLDFDLVSSLREKTPPCWEGIWTSQRILQIVSGTVNNRERCFLYVLNDANQIELWEMDLGLKADNGTTPITWSVTTPSYNAGDSDRFKALESGSFVIQGLDGTLNWSAQYRSDQNPCWQPWDSGQVCALTQTCNPAACVGPQNLQPQQRSPIRIRTPDNTMDTINARRWRTGYEMQVQLSFTGYAELKQLRINLSDQSEDTNAQRNVS